MAHTLPLGWRHPAAAPPAAVKKQLSPRALSHASASSSVQASHHQPAGRVLLAPCPAPIAQMSRFGNLFLMKSEARDSVPIHGLCTKGSKTVFLSGEKISFAGKQQLLRSDKKTSSFRKPLLAVKAEAAQVAREEPKPKTQRELEMERQMEMEMEPGMEAAEVEVEEGRNGSATKVMVHEGKEEENKPKLIAYDYGFQAAFLRKEPTVPGSVLKLAFENFGREYKALRRNYLFEELSDVRTDNVPRTPLQTVAAYSGRAVVAIVRFLDRLLTIYDGLPEIKPQKEIEAEEEVVKLREQVAKLTLSNKAVWDREYARPPVEAPWIILAPYYALCLMLDVIFKNRPIQRFWFLETVARMPYFSYISMLHLYETLGWWRVGAEIRKVHFAEEWNEMHHLKIMESLGGDRLWVDRFFGQHAAFFYYWILNGLFLISPKIAYNFSELIEMHAVDTYGTFVDENEALLKQLPPSPVAIAYYLGDDLYMFDEFQTSRMPESRRPPMTSLYDVFSAIRDDEMEHVKTMAACQELQTVVVSPNRRRSMNAEAAAEQAGESN